MKKEALLWEKLEGEKVHCHLCAHGCIIPDAKFGICRVRQNTGGVLATLNYGRIIAAHVDPIEKKPLYHFLPGSRSYSLAAMGCNFQCGFCQNWQISQVPEANTGALPGQMRTPEQVVDEAKQHGCLSISYTYTEPTIFFEYAYDTSRLAKVAGLSNVFVTNGYMTGQALEMIQPYLDAANVDLKSFRDDFYRKHCKARLQPVLDTIAAMKERNIWVEVTTLIIPGENDSADELAQIAVFLSGIDKDIPWHISRFHPDYRFVAQPPTPLSTLKRAEGIGREKGLRHVYLGNVQEGANTYCHQCHALLVERRYMGTEHMHLKDGRCPACGTTIRGIWS